MFGDNKYLADFSSIICYLGLKLIHYYKKKATSTSFKFNSQWEQNPTTHSMQILSVPGLIINFFEYKFCWCIWCCRFLNTQTIFEMFERISFTTTPLTLHDSGDHKAAILVVKFKSSRCSRWMLRKGSSILCRLSCSLMRMRRLTLSSEPRQRSGCCCSGTGYASSPKSSVQTCTSGTHYTKQNTPGKGDR